MVSVISDFQRRPRVRKWRRSMSFTGRDAGKLPLYVHLEMLHSLWEPQFPPVPVGEATPDFRAAVVRSTEFSGHFAITCNTATAWFVMY